NYQNSIANADLVTVDIGWNNFGVYLCNQLVDYLANGRLKWETNLEDILYSVVRMVITVRTIFFALSRTFANFGKSFTKAEKTYAGSCTYNQTFRHRGRRIA
ncbi:MAG: hypothetical protein II307_02775, partial [Alistipes sp.]|nr:hypothetical protein [Alistipes sp.]